MNKREFNRYIEAVTKATFYPPTQMTHSTAKKICAIIEQSYKEGIR
jgi:hypothetical protein